MSICNTMSRLNYNIVSHVAQHQFNSAIAVSVLPAHYIAPTAPRFIKVAQYVNWLFTNEPIYTILRVAQRGNYPSKTQMGQRKGAVTRLRYH
jgi:hypothetical protein